MRAVLDWLHHSPEAKRLRQGYVAEGLNSGLEHVEQAPDGLELAKGRERINYFKWIAERLVRDHYGSEPTVQVNVLSGDQAATRIRQLEQELGIDTPRRD